MASPAPERPVRRPRVPHTDSGLPLKPVYRAADAGPEAPPPGQYPFTRGIYPEGYRTRLWTIRQYAGYGTAAETNRRFRYLLEQGQTGLAVAFDLPTQIGHDADAPMARGEVGKVGVSISSLRDMEILFDGIPLDRVSTSMTINAPAALLLLLYELVAEQQGVPSSKLSGTVQNDILKEYASRGTDIFQLRPSMPLTAQQPRNNIIRVALQSMSAVLGGTQSLHACSYDEALGLPSEEAATLSVRTQQVIAHETNVPNVADPLGGSYLVEALTDQVESGARHLMGEVEAQGGAVAAIESGFTQAAIQESAYRQQQAVEDGQRIEVGVNRVAGER